jgi:exodeoxyribonuclease VII large subunit
MQRSHQRLGALVGRLDALSPLAVLSRGYSIVKGPGGRVLREAHSVAIGEQVNVMLHKGALICRVESTEEGS